MNFIPLSYQDILISSVLLFLSGALSIVYRLKISGQLLIGAIRMIIQLTLVGYVLSTLFELVSPWLTLAAAIFMITFAGREIMVRQERRFKGWSAFFIGFSTMLMAASLVTLMALLTQIRPDPWYHPRYALPILGMILGNTMTGISLALNTMTSLAFKQKKTIEARLALGADRKEALETVTRQALRSGLMPIINSMASVGLVSIPGMMTGQILAGIEPQNAVKYQLLIMFLITGATTIGVIMVVLLAAHRLTDERHRLILKDLTSAKR